MSKIESVVLFGKRVKETRLQRKMSQLQLATLSGYTDRSSIAKIETGNMDISRSKISAIANALNVAPAYLMGWTDNPQPVRNEITTERLSALGFDIDKLSKLDENDLLIIRSTLTSLIDTLFQRKK